MPSAVSAICDDFRRELGTIRALLNQTGSVPPGAVGASEVRLAASNASMLLLAASFEEFVRQVAKDYAQALIDAATVQSPPPDQMLEAAWERALYLLKGQKFGKRSFSAPLATQRVQILRDFCLDKLASGTVPDLLSYNMNNVTVSEFNDIFKRLGLGLFAQSLCAESVLIAHFQALDADEAMALLLETWGKFYEQRNNIAHSIGAFNTTGAGEILRYMTMLTHFLKRLR